MNEGSKIYVAGAQTYVGAAIIRELQRQGYTDLSGDHGDSSCESLLTDPNLVDREFSAAGFEYVFLVAGESGGISANIKFPARLMLDNLLIECNVIDSAHRHGVKNLLYLASSCVYPRDCPQPMREEYLLTGPLEPTNEAYALAKIAGIKLCQAYNQQFGSNFISGIPANIFGPGDDFSPEESHVIPALIRRMHEAKVQGADSVEIWGTGNPRREFIYVDDLAAASVFVMNSFHGGGPINIGNGADTSIGELATAIKNTVGYPGRLQFNPTQPDGMPQKSLDTSRLTELGWHPQTPFQTALQATYSWFLSNALPE